MQKQRFMLGAAAGFSIGYLAWRAYEALHHARKQSVQSRPDAAAYGRERRALAVAGVARSLCGTLAFAFGPMGEVINRATGRAPLWARPAIFAALTSAAGSVVELPASFVEDYVLERRYGLTEQEPRAWLADYAKSSAVSTAVIALLAPLGGLLLRKLPKTWPIAGALATFPLLLLANLIVPLYILPLFNRFEPLEKGPLETRLRKLASRFGVGDAEILRMNMSKQTKKANAFVTGIAQTHRIVLGDTLIDNFEPDEIEFVVAHELGHYVAKDTWRMIAIGETAVTLLLLSAYGLLKEQASTEDDTALSLTRVFALLSVGMQLLQPALLAFSRSREWAADRFAIDTTNDARSGAAAFRRLRDQNLAEDEVPAWYEFFFSSHPSLGKRIDALERA